MPLSAILVKTLVCPLIRRNALAGTRALIDPPALVLAHVQDISINGSDPGESIVTVRPESPPRKDGARRQPPTESDASAWLVDMLAKALDRHYLDRSEGCVGGPGASAALAQRIVDAVFGVLRKGYSERDAASRKELKATVEKLGSAIDAASKIEP